MKHRVLGFRGYIYSDELGERLYKWAFKPVVERGGTQYPCTQRELDNLTGYPSQKEVGRRTIESVLYRPTLSIEEATRKLEHYCEDKTPKKPGFGSSLKVLQSLLRRKEEDVGPDIIFKIFNDFDIVFFRGKLQNHIVLEWRTEKGFKQRSAPVAHTETKETVGFYRRATIAFNADWVLKHPNHKLETMTRKPEFIRGAHGLMLAVLLHEMVVGAPNTTIYHNQNPN